MEFNLSNKPEEGNHRHHQHGSFSTAGAGGSSSTSAAPPTFLEEGKFLLKLRFPKSAEEAEESGKMADDAADSCSLSSVRKTFSHYCSECNKGFSSGKALGGHMSSAHVQARDNFKKLKTKKSDRFFKEGSAAGEEVEDEEDDAGGDLPICVICGKDFPSKKSLYGHMRCHPEREWRGMLPPTSKEEAARKALPAPPPPRPRPGLVDYDDEAADENSDGFKFKEENHNRENLVDVFGDSAHGRDVLLKPAFDLTRSLSSWVVTGKRGRESLEKTLELEFDNEGERKGVYDAVDQLIRLANGDQKESMSRNNSSTPSADLKDGKDFPAKKRKFSSEIAGDDDDSEETLEGEIVLGEGKVKANVSAGALTGSESSVALMASESSVEKSRSSAEYSKDSCGLCLGCHENNYVTADHEELDSMKIDVMKDDHNVVGKIIKGNLHKKGEMTPYHHPDKHKCHKCRTCKKIFPSPQALGGHMASHNTVKVHVHNTADDHGSSDFGLYSNDGHSDICVSRLAKGIEAGSGDDSRVKDRVYMCEICQKTFSSGQALGGHKRSHYSYANVSSQSASPVNNQAEPEKSGKSRKNLKFDLTVALEEDQTADGHGF